jgi:hypothetical protein
MSDMFSTAVAGLPETQDALRRIVETLRPDGGFGNALEAGAIGFRDYVASITPRQTGTLAGAHRVEVIGLRARVYVDPGAINPRSGQSAAAYAGPMEARHSFYQRTANEYGERGKMAVADALFRRLP